MNKIGLLIIGLMMMLLVACGSESSWEHEYVSVVSDRLMADTVKVNWSVESESAEIGKPKRIRLEIEKEDGQPVQEFDINHEKLLHLIVVSKDLSYFNHIHPEYKGDGVFEIMNDFPFGGDYRLIADFKPTGGDSMTKMEWIQVDGEAAPTTPSALPERVKPLIDLANGKKVNLAVNGLEAKQESTLVFTIEDEATSQPITDLEPYLGAIGHVVILSEDGERYVHVHAEEDQGSGPEAKFETSFPKSGLYKVWAQFQQNSEVFTVSYILTVPE